MSWPETTARNAHGALEIGGVSLTDLAQTFGTPLYLFDEQTLRSRARGIRDVFCAAYPKSRIVYAGKAYLSPALMRVLVEESVGLDVVSGGEIRAGLLAGVDPSHMIFHGNNKSRPELELAVTAGVGLIALDNDYEISLLTEIAAILDRDAPVVIRLNPGVDPHTHRKMRTGAVDSKFGFPIWDGQAMRAVQAVCATDRLRLVGYHAHVGSQIFDAALVERTIATILDFAASARDRYGVVPSFVIPGGGFGIADDASGQDVSIADWAQCAADAIRYACLAHRFEQPTMVVEPGRAIIGPAGVALYEVGSRKSIPGVRTYISVDGGMADNIRPSLYGARYSCALANRTPRNTSLETVTIAGKYCESGDILIEDVELPPLRAGDLLAVPMSGAYSLAMASNYNLALRPAVVLIADGRARLVRRRETYDDVFRCDILDQAPAESAGHALLSPAECSL